MKTTGLHSAGTITPGSTIARVYWTVAGAYTATADGQEHDSIRAALVSGITLNEPRVSRFFRGQFAVDCRFLITGGPDGRSRDVVAERFTYDDLADARAHLERIDRYTPAGGGR